MNPLLVSILVVFIVAAGLIGAGTTGFFTMSVPDVQEADNVLAEEKSPFRVSLGLGEKESNDMNNEPEEEVPEEEPEETPPVTGLTTGSRSGSNNGNSCTAKTCSDLGYECGSWPDTCGGTVTCETCGDGYTCSEGACVNEFNAKFSVSPENSNVSVNDTFSLNVEIDTNAATFAVAIEVSFNNSVLEVIDVSEGNFLDSDAQEPARMEFDNDNGKVEYAHTRVAPQEGKSGAGTLITIQFSAISQADESDISLTETIIVEYDDLDVAVNKSNGVVKVNE